MPSSDPGRQRGHRSLAGTGSGRATAAGTAGAAYRPASRSRAQPPAGLAEPAPAVPHLAGGCASRAAWGVPSATGRASLVATISPGRNVAGARATPDPVPGYGTDGPAEIVRDRARGRAGGAQGRGVGAALRTDRRGAVCGYRSAGAMQAPGRCAGSPGPDAQRRGDDPAPGAREVDGTERTGRLARTAS